MRYKQQFLSLCLCKKKPVKRVVMLRRIFGTMQRPYHQNMILGYRKLSVIR